MTTIHHLPIELIQMISDKLTSAKDLYIGLTVSRLWYSCFYRSLYRYIHIVNRRQFQKWLDSLPHPHHIRHITFGSKESLPYRPEDYMNGSVPPSSVQMGVTLHELNTILSSLPLLESFHFDARVWGYLNVHGIHISTNIRSLPPLDHPRQFVMLTKSLTRLHLQGADIFSLHQRHQLLCIFDQTPSLRHLKMARSGTWDTNYKMPFSMEDMDTLHAKLPFLQDLFMVNVMHLTSRQLTKEPVAVHLKRLKITATCDTYSSWFRYLSKKYPALTSLGLNIIPKQVEEEEALVTLVNSFDQLKSIAIHHDMGRLFIGNAFLTLVCNNNKKWHNVQLGLLNTPSSIQQLISGGGDRLTSLTLSCNRKSDTCYPIQSILASCPQLTSLELRFGRIVENPHRRHNRLKRLRLHNVRMGSRTLFQCFPLLETLFLRECVFDNDDDKGVFPIDVSASCLLSTLILSELKVADDTSDNKLVFLKKQEENDIRWYKEIQHQDTFQFYLQRQLLDVQECYVALACQSVKTILFNGCKI
ncbi:hypothetical protein K501DRAFT_251413 [Backusella circina FSU 941]|nr:hypothetical protein K501DRAFT_251413 [Backusella circina FSU 941]